MSNFDYRAMSDGELVERLEKGKMQKNSELYAEFTRRMQEKGTFYNNTPQDEARWQVDITSSAQRE